MKFGKRLAAEAARRHGADAFFDYKLAKRAVKEDVASGDAQGTHFQQLLVSELQKVSAFYSSKTSQLEAEVARCVDASSAQRLQELRGEVQELIKFVALNYLAVVKSIKKRNRHLQENFGAGANTALHALDLLVGEVFFTSPRLANLATQAEVLARDLQARQQHHDQQHPAPASPAAATAAPSARGGGSDDAGAAAAAERQQLLEEYQCPVCLDTLHNPVVLTCAHRFCWGCLVAHCTACRDQAVLPLGGSGGALAAGPGYQQQQQQAQQGAGDQEGHGKAHHDAAGKAPPPGAAAVEGQEVELPTASTTYRMLELLAIHDSKLPQFFPCPVCRKPQILDIDALQVDTHLDQFITNLQDMSAMSVSPGTTATTTTVEPAPHHPEPQHLVLKRSASPAPLAPEPWGIIPPQAPEHKGKLCVFLDLDGTLVSSFTPKRAPRLPPYVRTHVVGIGSKLNPQGVFVVERPGLSEFLEQLAAFAEVIIFTAGLEDYASPIIDAIDPKGRFFAGRIYREGTLRTDHYSCVKDMARVNRDLARTVLVDDTPLAFIAQPDNGIPILGFRGDPDDRLLLEAVLPLLQALATEKDVQPVLRRRFAMAPWFKRHGFPIEAIVQQALVDAAEERDRHMAEALAQLQASGTKKPAHASSTNLPHLAHQTAAAAAKVPACLLPAQPPAGPPTRGCLLIASFDRALLDFDAGERLVEQLAPELLPMMVRAADDDGDDGVLADPAAACASLPLTNSLLSEVQRRGVSRDELLAALRSIGAGEVPAGAGALLRALRQAGVDVRVVSGGSNSVFVSHVLAGAKLSALVQDVVTNPAAFERAAGGDDGAAEDDDSAGALGASPAAQQQQHKGGHRLVVRPWQGEGGARPAHQCSLCPPHMCKGREVRAVRQAGTYRRVALAGSGAEDVCAALCLGPGDLVLARAGGALARYLARAKEGKAGALPVQAAWRTWRSHEELQALALGFAASGTVASS